MYSLILMQEKMVKEPDVAEFISALAAGNNAQLMVVACPATAGNTTFALVAAAQQTSGRVVCIVNGPEELRLSKKTLGLNSSLVEFVIGEAQTLLSNDYKEADFVLVDCTIMNYDGILSAVQTSDLQHSAIVLGYNAFCKESWGCSSSKTQLLPIGEGLLVTRIGGAPKCGSGRGGRKTNWVVKVDKWTGEEHVFRVRSPQRKRIQA